MFEASYTFIDDGRLPYTINIEINDETWNINREWTAGGFISFILNNINNSLMNYILYTFRNYEDEYNFVYGKTQEILENLISEKADEYSIERHRTASESYLSASKEYVEKRNRLIQNEKNIKDELIEKQKQFIKKLGEMVLCDTNYQNDSPYTMADRLFAFKHIYRKDCAEYMRFFVETSFSSYIYRTEYYNTQWKNFMESIDEKDSIDGVLEIIGENRKHPIEVSANVRVFTYFEFIMCLVKHMLENDLKLKLCKNCGKYFYPENRTDTLYCDEQSPQDATKTCKEYGKYMSYQSKLKESASMILHKQLYNIFRHQYNRSKNEANRKIFDEFVNQSSRMKSEVKLGIKTEEEYVRWLTKVKEKREIQI